MLIHADGLDHRAHNEAIRSAAGDCTIDACLGQRFIAAGMADKHIVIRGVPGNALGAYLNGGTVTVAANAQDAVGDTMNDGKIIIHGDVGDAAGYAMRGGRIYVKGNAGYRAGIHMKAYREKVPLIVIGGKAGSFWANTRPAVSLSYSTCRCRMTGSWAISPARDARREDVPAFGMPGHRFP
jgi:formylmethanofuran dehydrogenase subunit C